MYWDIKVPLSYDCLFNFIVGARGTGKTYGCKDYAIKDFLKRNNQFVYVRRFKTELKKNHKFFDDIKGAFPDHEFKVDGMNYLIDGKACGNAIALSTSKIEKSTPYPNVTTIIFDEFILDKGAHHYLPDEVTNFLELYSTVARLRDVRVFFISNALTVTNPYFLYFDLKLPYNTKGISAKNDILVQMVQANEYEEKASSTRFGKLVSGTPYGEYAIHNKFLRDTDTFIGKKTKTAKYVFTLRYKGNNYGVWIDYNEGLQYLSSDVDQSCKVVYSVTMDDHTPNTLLLKGQKSVLVEQLLKNYKAGVVRFENINLKNICSDILKMSM